VYDEDMTDALRVTVVATGIGRPARKPQLVAQTFRATGTHDGGSHHDTPSSYGDYDKPAVWRNARGSASAQVAALEEKGVDRLDIPAFLRKQAD
jgi:cell division protein FtsZ